MAAVRTPSEQAELDRLVLTVNYWRAYRGQNEATLEEIREYHRLKPFIRTQIDADPDLPSTIVWTPGAPLPVGPPVYTNAQQAFLDTIPANLPATNQYWRGTKYIEGGNNVRLGVWEYQPPAGVEDRKKKFKKVVVKELLKPKEELTLESDNLTRLKYAMSPHILKTLCPPERYGLSAPEAKWEYTVKRLFLEYCPHGDLFDFMEIRRLSQRRYDLFTLWKMFECLVDGVCAMHYGDDPIIPDPSGDADEFLIEAEDAWLNIVHFDIKPENILVGDRDGQHVTPVLKFGDFGKSQKYGTAEKQDISNGMKIKREDWRISGTDTYFTPEQFSEEWDYLGWETSEIAGKYSSDKTNIFGVGILMYMLVTLVDEGITGAAQKPFLPNDFINGARPKGITWGPNLAAYNGIYSKSLTDLIYECLYENPNHRPDLQRLKYETSNAITVLQENNVDPEEWRHFLHQPPVAPVVQAAGLAVAQPVVAQLVGAQ
ncbi:kinase-like protein [Acephala macrosclerotiorum]|nr:kinase-like protein [Acephala macrosclerotiorum]